MSTELEKQKSINKSMAREQIDMLKTIDALRQERSVLKADMLKLERHVERLEHELSEAESGWRELRAQSARDAEALRSILNNKDAYIRAITALKMGGKS